MDFPLLGVVLSSLLCSLPLSLSFTAVFSFLPSPHRRWTGVLLPLLFSSSESFFTTGRRWLRSFTCAIMSSTLSALVKDDFATGSSSVTSGFSVRQAVFLG